MLIPKVLEKEVVIIEKLLTEKNILMELVSVGVIDEEIMISALQKLEIEISNELEDVEVA